jgi:nicotinamide-nucleotide amidase
VTGVAGPDTQDGVEVGTTWLALALPGRDTEAASVKLPGDRDRVRQYAAISLLDLLRLRLAEGV